MKCNECSHRGWEEGDREYSPPGYGTYYCDLRAYSLSSLKEDEATGEIPPTYCPLEVKYPNKS